MPRVMVVFGTRPEAIKVAPVINALQVDPRIDLITVRTAQHRDMLDQVVKLFDILPDIDLDVHTPGQTLGEMTQRILAELAPQIERLIPDMLLVQGDTTKLLPPRSPPSTSACQLHTWRPVCVLATSGRPTLKKRTGDSLLHCPRCTWPRHRGRPPICLLRVCHPLQWL